MTGKQGEGADGAGDRAPDSGAREAQTATTRDPGGREMVSAAAWLAQARLWLPLAAALLVSGWLINDQLNERFDELGNKVEAAAKEAREDRQEIRKEIQGLRTNVTENRKDIQHLFKQGHELKRRVDDIGYAPTWPGDFTRRREKVCRAQCNSDAKCYAKCATEFNQCGIRCPADLASPCLQECIKGMGYDPRLGF